MFNEEQVRQTALQAWHYAMSKRNDPIAYKTTFATWWEKNKPVVREAKAVNIKSTQTKNNY